MKHLSVVIFLLICLPATAQINRGQVIWTAGINSKYTHYKSLAIRNPIYTYGGSGDVSYFIRDGLAFGVAANGSWYKTKSTIDESQGFKSSSSVNSGSVTPFLRKYWKIKPVLIYVGGGVNLNFSRTRAIQEINFSNYGNRLNKDFGANIQTQLGVVYPVTHRLGLEFGAQSSLFPLSLNSLKIGLILASGDIKDKSENPANESPLSKGRWLLSGSFNSKVSKGYNTSSDGQFNYHDPSTFVEVAPAIFVRNRLLFGLGVYVGLREGVLNDDGKAGFTAVGNKKPVLIGLRPFVKKYFSPTRLTPYFESYISYDRIMFGGASATNSYNAGSNLGLAYLFGKSWLIEAGLLALSGGYSEVGNVHSDIATIGGGSRINLNLEAGLKPNLTVSYVFR